LPLAGFVKYTVVSENIGNTRPNTVVVLEPSVPDWSCADPQLARGKTLTCEFVKDFSSQAAFEAAVAGVTLTATVAPLGIEAKIRSVTIIAKEQASMKVEPVGSCTVPGKGE
jgi:hypothetical protein